MEAKRILREARIQRMTTNGTAKELHKFLKPWMKVLEAPKEEGSDLNAFLNKFGSGI